ncbi:hypothetical protein RND81_05G243900 [Saponaria officinalis]|uniref:Uncharacterized protein n=1 Tax=Saponaria officinalis TaxID=3572 RepID=A0AAW1KZG8_SAPOF
MVLVFIYLDRVMFKITTVPRVFPTLSAWSKEYISKRVNAEKCTGYGKGGIEDRLVKSSTSVPGSSAPGGSDGLDPVGLGGFPGGPKSVINRLAETAIQLAQSYDKFLQTLVEAKSQTPDSDVVRQMASLAKSFFQGSNEHGGKGDAETSTKDKNGNVVDENGNNGKQKTCPEYDEERTATFREFASYKEFSSEEELLAALIKLETALGKRQKNEDSEYPDRAPSSDTAIPQDPVKEVEQPQEKVEQSQKTTTTKKKLRKTISTHRRKSLRISSEGVSPPSFKLLSSQSDEGDGVSESPSSPLSSPTILETSPVSSLPPPVKKVPPPSKRNIVISDVLKSPFRERTINISYDITHSEKQLLDVVLCPSLNDRSGNYTVSRGALKTILSGERVHNTVIDAWCHILNKNEKYKSRESPSCLYLPSTMFDPIEGIDVDKSALSLIFNPVTYEKTPPFLVCANFKRSTLEIIHPMKPCSVKFATYLSFVRDLVIRHVGDSMPVVKSVSWMSIEEIVPKSDIIDGVDTGVYLMRILETYKGVKKNYSIGLQDDHQVKRFSFRACHYILSCNENNLKVKVEEDSRSLITSSTQTDTDLVNYVCKGRKELNEILIDTEWMQVTRAALRTLKRRAWVMDMVIDMFGVMCTLNTTGFFLFAYNCQACRPNKKKLYW